MKGAIFFSGQYGSTAQYADWISEATGLPVFDVKHNKIDPSEYDFLILGSSVIVYKLTIRKWLKANLSSIGHKPIILFTVSGAPPGEKLDGWVKQSLLETPLSQMQHVALGGKLNHNDLSWWLRLVLRMGAWKNDDPKAKKEELEGFDFMDKSSIEPIVERVKQIQSSETVSLKHTDPSPGYAEAET